MIPDPLQPWYDHLPFILRLPIWFAINIILIRGILANEIMSEIRHRSRRKGSFTHTLKLHLGKSELFKRKGAIFTHYRLQTKGSGHAAPDVLDCTQGHCAIL